MYHDPQNPDNVRRKRRRLKILLIVLLVLVTTYVAYRLILIQQVNRRMAAIRASGLPITPEELNRWCKAPPLGQNAADIYLQAMAVLCLPGSDECELPIVGVAELPDRTTPLAPEMKQGIAGYLRQNTRALRLLHQGATFKAARYPVDYSKGMLVQRPLDHAHYGFKCLLLEGILNAEANRSEQAAQDLIAMLGVARSLENEPDIFFNILRINCNAMTVSGLEWIVNRIRFTDNQLIRMIETLCEAEGSQGLFLAMVGERAMGHWLYQHPEWVSPLGIPVTTSRTSVFPASVDFLNQWIEEGRGMVDRCLVLLYKASGLLEKDFMRYLDWMNEYLLAAQLPTDQRYTAAVNVESKITGLLRFSPPPFSRSFLMDVRNLADLRKAITTLAVERYRLATGNLPDRLDQLVPKFLDKVPADPFDLRPLRYKRLSKGYIVYSVGEDQIDDGGKEKNAEGRTYQSGADITFTVEH